MALGKTAAAKARAPFVGLDRKTNEITTFHMKTVPFLEKNAPSLGWSVKPSPVATDTIGINTEIGWRPPYRKNI